MKRFIAITIALCFLCVSTGFTVQLHYCMGKVVEISLAGRNDDEHACKHCGMEKKSSKGCCKNEYKIFKPKTEAAFSKATLTFGGTFEALTAKPVLYPVEQGKAPEAQQQAIPGRPHGPPLSDDMRLHVRNCVFLI